MSIFSLVTRTSNQKREYTVLYSMYRQLWLGGNDPSNCWFIPAGQRPHAAVLVDNGNGPGTPHVVKEPTAGTPLDTASTKCKEVQVVYVSFPPKTHK